MHFSQHCIFKNLLDLELGTLPLCRSPAITSSVANGIFLSPYLIFFAAFYIQEKLYSEYLATMMLLEEAECYVLPLKGAPVQHVPRSTLVVAAGFKHFSGRAASGKFLS